MKLVLFVKCELFGEVELSNTDNLLRFHHRNEQATCVYLLKTQIKADALSCAS